MHDLVDIVAGHDKRLQDMQSLLRFFQVETRAAYHDIMTVLHKVLDALFQVQKFRTAFHECNAIDSKAALQGGHLEQLIENYIGIGITLDVHHYP